MFVPPAIDRLFRRIAPILAKIPRSPVGVSSVSLMLVMIVGAALFWSPPEKGSTPADIPLPFASETSLGASVLLLNRHGRLPVVKVELPEGEEQQQLLQDRIYLVATPRTPAFASIPLDFALRRFLDSKKVAFFGYKYKSFDGQEEKDNRHALAFTDRFPGTFFASGRERQVDAISGSSLVKFERERSIRFLPADYKIGSVRFENNALYALIINEDGSGAYLSRNPPAVCGDGWKMDPEKCDDGNTLSGDGCSGSCAIEADFTCIDNPSRCTHGRTCGNSVIDGSSEQCDDGNDINGDGCSCLCRQEVCGNGILDPGEWCDDGNTKDGDFCPGNCQPPNMNSPICGNGVQDPGEGCDDQNIASGDGCSAYCQLEYCGNGVIEPSEQCDDGNAISGDGCDSTCHVEPAYACSGMPSRCSSQSVCGNGILEPGEQCDDGNLVNNDGCSSMCKIDEFCSGAPLCGNGVREGTEQCDDGNRNDGDDCSNRCTVN